MSNACVMSSEARKPIFIFGCTAQVVSDLIGNPEDRFCCDAAHMTFMFSAKLTARIVVAPDYPAVAPVFAISVKWQSERSALNDFHLQVWLNFVY